MQIVAPSFLLQDQEGDSPKEPLIFLSNFHSKCLESCTRIRAAIAYADADKLDFFTSAIAQDVPVEFFGRYDGGCPIDPRILRWFLDRKDPDVTCSLVPKWLHAKVIWWVGAGVYIGSANLTDRAWMKNYEAGVFISQDELEGIHADLVPKLLNFFDRLRQVSMRLAEEHYAEAMSQWTLRNKMIAQLERMEADFDDKSIVTRNARSPIEVVGKKKQNDRLLEFSREWNRTIQILRDLQERVVEFRPDWVPKDTPAGVQVDQFLHAYYFQQVRKSREEKAFIQMHRSNKGNRKSAERTALEWWQSGEYDKSHESLTIQERAPTVRKLLSPERLGNMAREDWINVATRVFAFRDHALRVENQMLGIESGTHDAESRARLLAGHVWEERSSEGMTIVDLLKYVVSGPGEQAERIWRGANSPRYRLGRVGVSTLGELVGWANPDIHPPRNGRTNKALFALGYEGIEIDPR
jgi:hypothetical protein